MKLTRLLLLTTVCLAFLACVLGFAPATGGVLAAESATAQADETVTSDAEAEAVAGETAAAGAADPDKPEPGTPAYTARVVEMLQSEYNLPAQRDTGPGSPNFWMPQAASTHAEHVDFMWNFIMAVTVIFTLIVVVLMTWFLIKYRAKGDDEPDPTNVVTHSTTLEITWTVIPTCIVLVMFVLGFRGYLDSSVAPPSAYNVKVNGFTWGWNFTYPDGRQTPNLHLPKGRDVRFELTSSDVLHSSYVPAFRLKKDVVPGRINSYWVNPTQEGIFELFCTEYCGQQHSEMVAKVFVYDAENYDAALDKMTNIYADPVTGDPRPPAEVGKVLWSARGCMGCHSIDGSDGTGPTWQNLWMANRQFTDGTEGVADANYIRESIYYPARKIVVGYGNAMPGYLGQLDERDVSSITEYIKTLSPDKAGEDGSAGVEAEAASTGDEE